MERCEEKLGTQFKNIHREIDGIAKDLSEISKENRRNSRMLISALVVIALALVGVVVYGFVWL